MPNKTPRNLAISSRVLPAHERGMRIHIYIHKYGKNKTHEWPHEPKDGASGRVLVTAACAYHVHERLTDTLLRQRLYEDHCIRSETSMMHMGTLVAGVRKPIVYRTYELYSRVSPTSTGTSD